MSYNKAVAAYPHIMGYVHQVVYFGPISNNCISKRAAVYAGIGAYFHAVAYLYSAKVLKFQPFPVLAGMIPEPIGPNHGACVNGHVMANAHPIVQVIITIQYASFANAAFADVAVRAYISFIVYFSFGRYHRGRVPAPGWPLPEEPGQQGYGRQPAVPHKYKAFMLRGL
jgi:hypothetical protein